MISSGSESARGVRATRQRRESRFTQQRAEAIKLLVRKTSEMWRPITEVHNPARNLADPRLKMIGYWRNVLAKSRTQNPVVASSG